MDRILLIVFGSLSTAALAFGGFAIHRAMKSAKKNDGEIGMAFWSIAALGCLTFAGMSWAYFIMPILINHYFR